MSAVAGRQQSAGFVLPSGQGGGPSNLSCLLTYILDFNPVVFVPQCGSARSIAHLRPERSTRGLWGWVSKTLLWRGLFGHSHLSPFESPTEGEAWPTLAFAVLRPRMVGVANGTRPASPNPCNRSDRPMEVAHVTSAPPPTPGVGRAAID